MMNDRKRISGKTLKDFAVSLNKEGIKMKVFPKVGRAVKAALNDRVNLTVYDDGYLVISNPQDDSCIVLAAEEFEEVVKFYYRNGG